MTTTIAGSPQYAVEVTRDGIYWARQLDTHDTFEAADDSADMIKRMYRSDAIGTRIVVLFSVEAVISQPDKIGFESVLKLHDACASCAPPQIFQPEDLDAALAKYEEVTSVDSYLGGKRRAQLFRVTTIYERIKG